MQLLLEVHELSAVQAALFRAYPPKQVKHWLLELQVAHGNGQVREQRLLARS